LIVDVRVDGRWGIAGAPLDVTDEMAEGGCVDGSDGTDAPACGATTDCQFHI
jgi:hypothetical protein